MFQSDDFRCGVELDEPVSVGACVAPGVFDPDEEFEWFEGDNIIIAERVMLDAEPVEQRAVTTSQIHQDHTCTGVEDGRVDAADRWVLEANLAAVAPAQECHRTPAGDALLVDPVSPQDKRHARRTILHALDVGGFRSDRGQETNPHFR